jgi:hypothetical protein
MHLRLVRRFQMYAQELAMMMVVTLIMFLDLELVDSPQSLLQTNP